MGAMPVMADALKSIAASIRPFTSAVAALLLAATSAWLADAHLATQPASSGRADIRFANSLLAASAANAAASRPRTEVKVLSCQRLADIPGKSVTTALVTFPPTAYSPAHRHPGSVTAFVVSGAIRSQMAGGPARVYAAGETWFEPSGALHLYAENPSTTATAKLLAVFVADHDCGPLVIPEPGR
jgi:quercetin dioxygenase-like cupin family protein